MSVDTQNLSGSLVLDTSILLEYFGATPLGKIVKEYFASLRPTDKVHLHLHTISELFYLLCRIKGRDFASSKLNEMLELNFITVHNSTSLAFSAGELKCAHSISLADCSCLATAEFLGIPAVFRREKELEHDLSRRPFRTRVILLA